MLLVRKSWVYPVLFLLFFAGCRKPTSANWDVDAVLPVINSSLNISNFLGDSIFKTDNNGLLILSVQRELAALKLDSLLALPDTVIKPDKFHLPLDYTLQPNYLFSPNPTDINFKIGDDVKLKRADVRTGILTVTYSSDALAPLKLIYSLPKAKKDGQPLIITEVIQPGENSLVKNYDLAGYTLDLTGQFGTDFNTITQTYSMGLAPDVTQPTFIASTQGITIKVSYSEITPAYVEGYFGSQVIDVDADTAKFDVAKNFTADNFMLSEAFMNFTIINEFGAEFRGNFSGITPINTRQGHSVTLATSKLSNININSAKKTGAGLEPGSWPVNLNSSNSNIVPFISNLPDQLTYSGKVILNPNEDISSLNNFAYYNTGIRIMADINIPMRFTANYFRLQSQSPVDFSNVNQLDRVNNGRFVISANNGYPFDATLQAYLLDGNQKVIDSLFIPRANTITRGQVDSQNTVLFPTRSRLEVPIGKVKIDNLRRTKFIKVLSYFVMPPNPPEIKLYESYQFDVNIIAEVNYNVAAE